MPNCLVSQYLPTGASALISICDGVIHAGSTAPEDVGSVKAGLFFRHADVDGIPGVEGAVEQQDR
jgi:hypothetical protein